MVDYKIQVYNGNEAFGTTGRTIAIQEQPRTISQDFFAEELHHANELIPKATIKEVIGNFAKVAARLMAEGFAIQFMNDGDVVLRLYADAKIKGGNINLQRARELTGDRQLEEAEMVSRATEIVQRAGVQLRAYAEVQKKFNELLIDFKPSSHVAGVEEKAYVEKKGDEADNEETGSENGQGGTSQQSGTGTSNTGNGGTQQAALTAPTISGNTSFTESTQVTMSGPDGADIHYTTDGSVPTSESAQYAGAITLTATTTVKAIAIKNGVSSDVTAKTFVKSSGDDDGE